MSDKNFHGIKPIIVIPVYNHAASLRDVVIRALSVHECVMVVDDGSSDGSTDTLKGLPIRILRHPVNRGKGAAILTAVKEARRLGMTHVVTIDADHQHDPADYGRFTPLMQADPGAIIVGKRDFHTPNVPRSSRFGRRFSNFWFRLQTGHRLRDTQSGFRAYPVAVLEKLRLCEKRYAFEVEVLVKAAWAGVRLREVEVAVFYPHVDERISHFRVFRDNLQISVLNTKLTLMSLLGAPHCRIFDNDAKRGKIALRHPIWTLKNLLTENSSPEQLAAAGGLGVLLGTLPLIGFHTLAILCAAGCLRLNKLAAVSASQLCMPPLVPALCIEAGYFFRHGRFLAEISMETLGYQGLERCYEWLIGSLLLGPLMAVLVGTIIYLMALLIRRTMHAAP